MKTPLPPCGLYRTTGSVGSIPAGRLVYFHNHGEPGPGLYLPASWSRNRVKLEERGTLLPSPEDVRWLEPLPPEGFYRVTETFYCCAKQCRSYAPETLVQLGYNAAGEAIVFVPELVDGMLAVPEQGSRVDHENFARLKQLKVAVQQRAPNMH
jgi:hypothetical protein